MTERQVIPTGNTYDKYASTNSIERRLMSVFMSRLERSLPGHAPAAILEVGVGEGQVAARVAAQYPDSLMVGLDLPAASLADHWAYCSLAPAFGDIAALPFPDRSFDLVLAIEVLEHVPRPAVALGEIARVAKRDVVLSVPREPLWRVANMARGRYLGAFGNTPGHVQHWTRRTFVRLVARHLEINAVHSPLPWTMVVARARRAGAHASADIAS